MYTINTLCFFRFPDDVYDRIWEGYNRDDYAQLNTFDTVDADGSNIYHPAAIVMETAATPKNGTKYLNFSWNSINESDEFYVYMHFAELEKLQSNQFRGFNITHNGNYWDGPIIPDYLSTTTTYSIQPSVPPSSKHQFSFFPVENSTLPPIINGLEIYLVVEISELESNKGDGMQFSVFCSKFFSSFGLLIIVDLWMYWKISGCNQ